MGDPKKQKKKYKRPMMVWNEERIARDKVTVEEYGLKNIELIKKEFIYHNKWKKLIPFKSKLKIFFIGIYEDLRFVFRKI